MARVRSCTVPSLSRLAGLGDLGRAVADGARENQPDRDGQQRHGDEDIGEDGAQRHVGAVDALHRQQIAETVQGEDEQHRPGEPHVQRAVGGADP